MEIFFPGNGVQLPSSKEFFINNYKSDHFTSNAVIEENFIYFLYLYLVSIFSFHLFNLTALLVFFSLIQFNHIFSNFSEQLWYDRTEIAKACGAY